MKNSQPRMKKRMMPVITSEAFSFRLNWEQSAGSLLHEYQEKRHQDMANALNLLSQDTMMAVNPLPPAVLVEMVCWRR